MLHRMSYRLHRRLHGFTLVELLVVIVVIAVLASLLLPALAKARQRADQVRCGSNLHQFSLAWMNYLYENRDKPPGWLSTLYPDYCSSKEIYVCAADRKKGKIDGSKPQDLIDDHASDAFDMTDDNWGNNGIDACSYFYEMCNTNCPFSPGETWAQFKLREKEGVDLTKFPVIRCYHHWKDKQYSVVWQDDSVHEREGMTINVAWAGNIFYAPECWNYKSFTGN